MLTLILLKQIIIMFLLMGVGAVLYKMKYITDQGAKEMGNILLRVIIPSVIIRSYIGEFTAERFKEMCLSTGLALGALIIAMIVAAFIFGKKKSIENFAASFSNAGFIGIPLTQAVFGSEAVFYVSPYVTFLNLFQWTYGVYIITGKTDNIRPKNLITNPMVVSLIIGLILFFIPIPIPEVIEKSVGFLASMNTPVAMLVLGVFLAKADLKYIFFDKKVYWCMAVRLLIVPLITLGVFYFLPIENKTIVLSTLIAACTSVGGNIAIFAQQYDKDYLLAIKTVCLSTLLSIITIPIFFYIVQIIYKIS